MKEFNWTGWSNFDYQYQLGSGAEGCTAETSNNFKFAFIWIAEIDRWKNLQFNQKNYWKDFQAKPELLQNLTESYWDFIISVFEGFKNSIVRIRKNLYWNIFLSTKYKWLENE